MSIPTTDAYLPGTASLIAEIDKKLLVVLRDGRTLIGYLRSIDQFANLLLQDTIERIHVGLEYGDIQRGIFLVRGENVVLLGEVDDNKPLGVELKCVPVERIMELQQLEQAEKEEKEKLRQKVLTELGLPATSISEKVEDMYS
eukprot:scpid72860/ scgid8742/ U6 snRNA-associated Sm-like protein LSm1